MCLVGWTLSGPIGRHHWSHYHPLSCCITQSNKASRHVSLNPNTQTNQFSMWFMTLKSLHISASETHCNVRVCEVINEVCALPCVFAGYSWQHANIKAYTGKLGHSSGQLNSVTGEKDLHC